MKQGIEKKGDSAWLGTEPTTPQEPWQKKATALSGKKFRTVAILDELSPPQLIAGFIYSKLGIIEPNPEVILRQDTRLNDWLKDNSLVLFDSAVTNPAVLTYLIDRNTALGGGLKAGLKRLAAHAGHYRHYPAAQWWGFGAKAINDKIANASLFNHLRYMILAHARAPLDGYQFCQNALEGVLDRSATIFHNLDDVKVSVPVLKNEGDEPDWVEETEFTFDRSRALLLDEPNQFVLAIGGSPNSGKSSLAASVYSRIVTLLEGCVTDGLLPKDTICADWCDQDLASPTMRFLLEGKEIPPDHKRKRPWNRALVSEAKEDLLYVRSRNPEVVVTDLPGLPTYDIAEELAKGADYSALVDRSFGVRNQPWRELLLGPRLPGFIVGVHTRYKEPNRQSGLRKYESKKLGDKQNFIRGRVVDLDRKIKLDDPFINLLAHALLFDYFPEAVIKYKRAEVHLLP